MKPLVIGSYSRPLFKKACLASLGIVFFALVVNLAWADDAQTRNVPGHGEISSSGIVVSEHQENTKDIAACKSRALRLRHEAHSERKSTDVVSDILKDDGTAEVAALPQCVDCGQPCVKNGTPCCAGTEDDTCWGVCEGNFPNTYCQ